MPPAVTKPSNDAEYLERMSRCIFTAGLNWKVVGKKWPDFLKAFEEFKPERVARFSGSDTKRLMSDQGIVRNERKIGATINNAEEFIRVKKEFGSFREYLDSFGSDEKRLQNNLQSRFHHLGPSTARMFLWSVGYDLTPNAAEKKWTAEHK